MKKMGVRMGEIYRIHDLNTISIGSGEVALDFVGVNI